MNEEWVAAAPITRETLEAAIEKIERPSPRHGSKENPHMFHPKEIERGHGYCSVCGMKLEDVQ
jgi:hypothetical protein